MTSVQSFAPRSASRIVRAFPIVAAIVGAFACGKESTAPKATLGVRVLAGADASDTILAQLSQALVIEVHDSAGHPASGAGVRFQSATPADPSRVNETAVYVCSLPTTTLCGENPHEMAGVALDTVDAAGRASAAVRLGTVAGRMKVYILVPTLDIRDSVWFTVKPGGVAHVTFTVPDTMVRVGGQYTVGAWASDRFFNARTGDVLTYSADGVVASVGASGAVQGLSIGRGAVTATVGQVQGTARVSVVPPGRVAAYRAGPASTPAVVELDLDGGNYVVRAPTWGGAATLPAWSPDGSVLTFADAIPNGLGFATLTLRDVDASGTIRNAVPGTFLYEFAGRYSRDGVWLYFHGNGDAGCCVLRVRADGSAPVELLTSMDEASHPSPSPDGTRVAFDQYGAIYVLTIADGAMARLAYDGDYPRWAPSGEGIAFTHSGTLSVANADGTGYRVLGDGFDVGVDWSPDGAWLIGSRAGQLTLVRVADGLSLPLHTSGDLLVAPAWKP